MRFTHIAANLCRSARLGIHLTPRPGGTVLALGVLRFAPDGLGPLARGTHLVKLTHVRFLLRTSAACTIRAERAWSARHTRRVAYAGAREPGPLAAFAFTVRHAHVRLLLRTSAACALLAEGAWFTRDTRRVVYAGAREPGPLATFAFTVSNAHVSLFLGLAVRRSFGPETPSATLLALCILGAITRCLRPLTLTANLVSYKQHFNINV